MNWPQLKTILWLRWRLMCNQWRRGGGLGAVFAAVVVIGALMLSATCFAGGLLGGIFGLRDASPTVVMMVWFGATAFFLFFWLIGLLTGLQRSETIDLQKLMHLPVALGQMFTVNYIVSHFTLSIVVLVPAMLGLGLGLAVARGPEMILLVPLALSMVFMITAWTYCLRGWLATMMGNPRRRRTIIVFITMALVLVAQGPNLYFNFYQNRNAFKTSVSGEERQRQQQARKDSMKKMFDNLVVAQSYIPPLWLPAGARALAAGNPLPALLGTLGCAAIALLGLRRAYRGTVRFYHGETSGKAAVKIKSAGASAKTDRARAVAGTGFLELRLPCVPEQSAALALATLRSLLRAPEVKMAWASSFVVTIILGGTFLLRATANIPDSVKPFAATAAVVFPVFFLAQFLANQFGFDRDGFRALMLSPADRRLILLGKNLAVLPLAAVYSALLIALVTARLHLSPLTVLATLFQLASVLLITGIAGNLLSLLVPYRIQPGSMKPTKMPGLAMVVLIFCQMTFPAAMSPVFAGPLLELLWRRLDLPAFVPVNLVCSALLCGVMMFAYWRLLAPLGRLLQRRETKILGVIAVEVE